MDEYYELLQVKRDASDSTIKKAYHKLSLKLHPDKGGDPVEFMKLKRAYEVLSDKDKKAAYDLVGLDIDQDEGEDQMFASESKEIMTILGSFAIRTLIGFLFIFFIYYTAVVVLATCGTLFLLYYSHKNPNDPLVKLFLHKAAIFTVLGWLALWTDWFRWILQTATLLEIIGLMPGPDTAMNIAAIATAICAVLSWWFGKSWSYYIYIMIFEAGLVFVVFLFFEFARVVIKTAMEMKLKKYGEKVREVIGPIKKENSKLQDEIRKLKARLQR